MRKIGVVFVLGCTILVIALGIGFADWFSANRVTVTQLLFVALAAVVVFLAVTGVMSKGKRRWMALTFAAILLLGFSVLAIFSLGLFTAPVALLLLGLSVWKQRHLRSK